MQRTFAPRCDEGKSRVFHNPCGRVWTFASSGCRTHSIQNIPARARRQKRTSRAECANGACLIRATSGSRTETDGFSKSVHNRFTRGVHRNHFQTRHHRLVSQTVRGTTFRKSVHNRFTSIPKTTKKSAETIQKPMLSANRFTIGSAAHENGRGKVTEPTEFRGSALAHVAKIASYGPNNILLFQAAQPPPRKSCSAHPRFPVALYGGCE